MPSGSKLIGFGAYVPERVLRNSHLEAMVDTSDEWILQRTGIRERHIAKQDQYAADMAISAVEDLVAHHDVEIGDVDQIIVSTFTPDHFTPHTAALVQGYFGMPNAGTFDLSAGCTGFTYALSVADALIVSGTCKKVLIVATEAVSKVVDYTDRSSCILFGDAAAACILEASEGEGAFLARYFHTDGDLAPFVSCTNFSDTIAGVAQEKKSLFSQNGQQVYKYVMKNIPQGMRELAQRAGMGIHEFDWFVPHSANMRMIQTICEKLSFPGEKTLTSIEFYGNTSSASIPLSLWLAQKEGLLKKGDVLALYGFGGGLTHGGVAIRF